MIFDALSVLAFAAVAWLWRKTQKTPADRTTETRLLRLEEAERRRAQLDIEARR